jgi:hypothetical protein
MDQFRAAIDTCGLSDLGYEGDKFTSRNHSKVATNYICERLDRALGNLEWVQKFPNFKVRNVAPRHSDHRPVIIDTDFVGSRHRGGDSSFRFEARWLREEGCDEVMKDAWERESGGP